MQTHPFSVQAKLMIFLVMCLLYRQFHLVIPQSENVIRIFWCFADCASHYNLSN